MKFLAIVLYLTATAVAAPAEKAERGCTPGTYKCSTNPDNGKQGWSVCDVDWTWKYGGDCPPNTYCQFNDVSRSPYCI